MQNENGLPPQIFNLQKLLVTPGNVTYLQYIKYSIMMRSFCHDWNINCTIWHICVCLLFFAALALVKRQTGPKRSGKIVILKNRRPKRRCRCNANMCRAPTCISTAPICKNPWWSHLPCHTFVLWGFSMYSLMIYLACKEMEETTYVCKREDAQ